MQSICKCFFKFIIIKFIIMEILFSCQTNKLFFNYFFDKYETIFRLFSLSFSRYSQMKIRFPKANWRLSGTLHSPHSSKHHTYILTKPEKKNFIWRKLFYLKRLSLIFGNGISLQKTVKTRIYTQTYVRVICYNMLSTNHLSQNILLSST